MKCNEQAMKSEIKGTFTAESCFMFHRIIEAMDWRLSAATILGCVLNTVLLYN